MLTFNASGRRRGRHARAGRRRWSQVRIVDPDGNEVAPGETGEIVARGPVVMNGYWNRARAERRRARPAAGTTPTTSAGARPTARSRFIGPKTRIIKSAAENIYPAEVEGCLAPAPGGGRGRDHRRARPEVGPEREGGRRR